MSKILNFTVNNNEFGLDLDYVERILSSKEITQIPESPVYIEGVINYQEQVISVMNLAKRLNILANNKLCTMIIVNVNDKTFGLLVDEVKGILETDLNNNSDKENKNFSSKLINGYLKLNDKIITILSVNELFNSKELI